MESSGEQFLHKKDPKLHTTAPVEHEQSRLRRKGEEVSQKPADKIADWLGVVENTHMGHKDDPRVLERIKGYYHRTHVIKPNLVPQSYWNLQGEIAVSEGTKQDLINSGVVIEEIITRDANGQEIKKPLYRFPEEVKKQAIDTITSDQEHSIDEWVDYLTSNDATYPMWAKYWAFRSVTKMGKFEKKEDGSARFGTRKEDTVAPFPLLNNRALAKTIGVMRERLDEQAKPKNEQQPVANVSTVLQDKDFQNLLSTEDFSKLYAQFLAESPAYSAKGLEETRGRLIKYNQGSAPEPLVKSLEGHPLEWCTADLGTARTQLETGDFYAYYSLDETGEPVIPRFAIRMKGSGEAAEIAEVRGIAQKQNLDPFIAPVVEETLEKFPDGKAYQKKVADMKRLTVIDKKVQAGSVLEAADLRFLYEIDSPIQGFGYSRDPRIGEIRAKREPELDMPIVFDCEPAQIARDQSQITADTKAYVGRLVPGIFDSLSQFNIEHVYALFPERQIKRQKIEIGGKTKEQLLHELKQAGVKLSSCAEDMMRSSDFTTSHAVQPLDTVRLKVGDLGLSGYPTTAQIYAKAQELGLDLCPAEVGPRLRLQYADQPLGEWLRVGMKQITDSHGNPCVFFLGRDEGGLWLYDAWASPDDLWGPDREFVFCLRPSASPERSDGTQV